MTQKCFPRKTPPAFVCAGWNLYSLRKNPRFYMSLLLGFLLCWLLTDKTMAISRTYLTNVQIVEPFVWCYADGDSILYAALVMMLMLSAFPRIDTPASYLIFHDEAELADRANHYRVRPDLRLLPDDPVGFHGNVHRLQCVHSEPLERNRHHAVLFARQL